MEPTDNRPERFQQPSRHERLVDPGEDPSHPDGWRPADAAQVKSPPKRTWEESTAPVPARGEPEP